MEDDSRLTPSPRLYSVMLGDLVSMIYDYRKRRSGEQYGDSRADKADG